MSSGEMARCSWYVMKGYNVGVANNIFAQAKADFRFVAFLNAWYWLSSEDSEVGSWAQDPVSGKFETSAFAGKYYFNPVRAAVAFKL